MDKHKYSRPDFVSRNLDRIEKLNREAVTFVAYHLKHDYPRLSWGQCITIAERHHVSM